MQILDVERAYWGYVFESVVEEQKESGEAFSIKDCMKVATKATDSFREYINLN